MKVLIADDEERYRDYLRASLAEHGHEVGTVDSGRTAIDYGVRFRPQVLVTDWMLKNHIHGLRVSNVLRAVDPSLQTIVITGFSSTDLQRDAKHSGVFRFIEKPFTLDQMVGAVDRAAAVHHTGPKALFGFLEIDTAGNIVNSNCKAREMLAETVSGCESLEQLFGDIAPRLMGESNGAWINVAPQVRRQVDWIMGSKIGGEGGIVVLLPAASASLRSDPLIRTLLEIDEPRSRHWPVGEHVLVIDDVREVRSLSVLLLEQIGCVSYKAESKKLALKLLRADPQAKIVILDYEMPVDDLAGFVCELRSIRRNVKIVGTSALDHRRAFASIGVDRFLDKGWQIEDLIEVIGA